MVKMTFPEHGVTAMTANKGTHSGKDFDGFVVQRRKGHTKTTNVRLFMQRELLVIAVVVVFSH